MSEANIPAPAPAPATAAPVEDDSALEGFLDAGLVEAFELRELLGELALAVRPFVPLIEQNLGNLAIDALQFRNLNDWLATAAEEARLPR